MHFTQEVSHGHCNQCEGKSLSHTMECFCQTVTHAAVVSGPVHHRLVVCRVSRQSKSGGVQVRLTLPRAGPSGFLPGAPVLGSGVGNTLDSLHKPLSRLRFSTCTPIHVFGVRCARAPFRPLLCAGKAVIKHCTSPLVILEHVAILFSRYFGCRYDADRRLIPEPTLWCTLAIARFQSTGCCRLKSAENFCAIVDFWFSGHTSLQRGYLQAIKSVVRSEGTYFRLSHKLGLKGEQQRHESQKRKTPKWPKSHCVPPHWELERGKNIK